MMIIQLFHKVHHVPARLYAATHPVVSMVLLQKEASVMVLKKGLWHKIITCLFQPTAEPLEKKTFLMQGFMLRKVS